MHHLLRILIPLIASGAIIITGCSDSRPDSATYEIVVSSTAEPTAQPSAPASRHRESATSGDAYHLGHSDALRLLDTCATQAQIQSALLDINARRYRISCMASETTADDYINGFLDGLKERGDTLYHTLAPSVQ